MKRAIVPLAPGFEEIEAVVVIDILRRSGVLVTVAGVGGTTITGSHGITVQCDEPIERCDLHTADAIVLPGGMPGTLRLRECEAVSDAVVRMHGDGKLVGAICAAPTVLDAAGVLEGRRATCHPNHVGEMTRCLYVGDDVVVDGDVVTSRGAGTAIEFAAELVRRLVGDEAAADVLARIQYRR